MGVPTRANCAGEMLVRSKECCEFGKWTEAAHGLRGVSIYKGNISFSDLELSEGDDHFRLVVVVGVVCRIR